MTTLTTAPVAPLLDRLFEEADAATSPAFADLSGEEWECMMRSKTEYLVESHLRPGALIVADNADYCPDYLERARSPNGGCMSTPFAEDVELSMSIGCQRVHRASLPGLVRASRP